MRTLGKARKGKVYIPVLTEGKSCLSPNQVGEEKRTKVLHVNLNSKAAWIQIHSLDSYCQWLPKESQGKNSGCPGSQLPRRLTGTEPTLSGSQFKLGCWASRVQMLKCVGRDIVTQTECGLCLHCLYILGVFISVF